MYAVDQIIGIHYRAHVAFTNRGFKSWEIDFTHGALIRIRTHIVTVPLLVVQSEVFYGRNHPLALHATDITHHGSGSEIRVFAEILKISPVHGRSINIYTRSQQEVDTTRTRVLAEANPDTLRKFRVPGCRKSYSGGKGRRRSPSPHSNRTVGHFERRQADCVFFPDEHSVGAADQVNFLFE